LGLALLVVAFWFVQFIQVRLLEKLPKEVDEKVMAKVSHLLFVTVFWAYLMLILALSFASR
jgi:hypothetical protein